MRLWKASACALCAAVLAGNAWYLSRDLRPPSFDDAWYLEISFRLFHALFESPASFLREYTGAFRIKAPLISLFPLPLYLLFGPGERVALWANEFFLAAIIFLAYAVGKALYGERAGLGAAAATALTPMIYGVSRVFFVECSLTAAVLAGQWAILRARPDSRRSPWELGLCLGLGLLIKSLYPLYLFGPILLKRRELRPHAKKALVIGAATASTWYAFNAPYVVGFGFSAGFGAVARGYGQAGVFSPSVLIPFFSRVGREVFSWPLLFTATAVGVLAWASLPKDRSLQASDKFLAAWFFVPFTVFTFGVNKELRYLTPILPAAAIALGAAAASLRRRRDAVLLTALLSLTVGVFCTQTFGVPTGPALLFNGPPGRDPGWARGDLLSRLAELAPAAPGEEPVVAIAVEHPRFNANNLACLSAARDLPYRFISLGYAQPSGEGALIRLKDKNARYAVFVDGIPRDQLPEFLNRANKAVEGYVWNGRLKAKLLAEIPIHDGIQARLYGITP